MEIPPAHPSGDPAIWALQPWDEIARTVLQGRYGGGLQGAIAPSRTSPNVMLFAEAGAGEQHGYFDGWHEDGCFHYIGEGRRGDQRMKSGNAAILNHRAEGRALRLFDGTRGRVVYIGEFAVCEDRPYYTTDAPEASNGPVRGVIMFRLRPLDIPPKPGSSPVDRLLAERVQDVPVEQQWTEKAFVAPSHKEGEAERVEHNLVLAYRDHLLAKGHDVRRLKIVPQGEAKPLFADLMDRTTNTLIEAKGSVARSAIRMAIGQLMDYRRFISRRRSSRCCSHQSPARTSSSCLPTSAFA